MSSVQYGFAQEGDFINPGTDNTKARYINKTEIYDLYPAEIGGDEEEEKKKKSEAKEEQNQKTQRSNTTKQSTSVAKKIKKPELSKSNKKPTTSGSDKDVASFNFVYYLIQRWKVDEVMD